MDDPPGYDPKLDWSQKCEPSYWMNELHHKAPDLLIAACCRGMKAKNAHERESRGHGADVRRVSGTVFEGLEGWLA